MGLWDEVVGIATRAGAKKKTQQSSKQGALSASPAVLRKSAKQPGLWDSVVSEASSFFKPAGVFYKNVQDLAHGGETDSYQKSLAASREKPTWQKMAGLAIHSWAPGAAPYLGYDPADNVIGNAIRALPDKAIPTAAHALNSVHVPQALQWTNPVSAATEALLHPIDTYNKVDAFARGVNPGDGDMQANMGSRGQEIWGNLQADVARVEDMNRQKPYVQRGVEAATSGLASVLPKQAGERVKSVAQYFDPNSEDVATAYEQAGYDPLTSLAGAMSNPLEWLGAESGGELATKLKDAGKLRKVVNAAGKLMDPTQMALDAAGKGVSKVAGIDWKLPGSKNATPAEKMPSVEEIARRAGVDPEAIRAYSNASDPAPPPPAQDELWSQILSEPAGDATQRRIAGLLQETDPQYLNRVARNIPDANAPVAPFEALNDAAPAAFDAAPVPHDYSTEFTDIPEAMAYRAPEAPQSDAFLMDQAKQAADEFDAAQEFQRQQAIFSRAKEAQLGRKLNDLTPSILPQGSVGDELRWLDFPRDPLLSVGEPSQAGIEAAMRAPRSWGDLLLQEGDRASQARQVATSLPVPKTEMDNLLAQHTPTALPPTVIGDALRWLDNGGDALGKEAPTSMGTGGGVVPGQTRPGFIEPLPDAQPLPASPAVGVVDEVAAPAVAARPNTLAGGLKLYSNPLDPSVAWTAAKAINQGIGDFFSGLESFIGKKADNFISSKPALSNLRTEMKRLFSENYGVASKELGDRITDFQMQGNAIRRATNETVYQVLNTGDETQRKAMMGYMNGSLKKADAAQVLPQEYLDAANAVRYLMDDAGAKYIATSLDIDADFLRQASTEEKQLVRQLYETFGQKQTNVGPKFNLTRKQVLANAAPTHSPQFIQKAQNLIDGAMQRLQKQGLVKDGRVVDMGLDFGTWIANLGKYEPRLYKAIEYGVDLSSPTAAMDFVGAIERRHQVTADALNELNKAQGLPPVTVKPMSDDIKNFLLANYTGEGGWNSAVAQEAGRFMKRKELSQELRDILGPMVNPAYTYTKGVQHVHLMENLLKMRRWVAGNDSMVSRVGETVEDFMKRTGIDRTDIAFDMATNPQYASQVGALQGRFMHRDVADMLASTGIIPHLTGPDALDKIKSLSRTWLAMSKVILNPTSHMRQFLQNGLSIWESIGARGVVDMFAGVKDLRSKSKAYLEARNAGLFSAGHDENFWAKVDMDSMPEFTWDGNEHFLAKIARSTEWLAATATQAQKAYGAVKRGASAVNNLAAKSFAAGDDLAKLAAFKHYRRQGFQPIEAARRAADEVYTGAGRSRYDRFQSGLGVRGTYLDRGARTGGKALAAEAMGGLVQQPFFGATKFVWDHAVRGLGGIRTNHWMPMTDPARAMRTWSLMAAAYGFGELSRQASGLTSEEVSARKPDYMRSLLPTHAMLPPQLSQLISSDGSTDWWDYSALVPYGVPAQGKFDVRKGRMTNILDNAAATFIPGIGATSKMTGMGDGSPINPMLKPWMELWQNQDSFSGRQIYPEHLGGGAQARPVMAHLWRSYLPPWAPNPAGLLEAWESRPTRLDDPKQMEDFVRAGLQGVATDSGHLASKFISGAANSIDYATLGQKVSESRRILDYRGRDQYMGKVFADLLGIRIESRMAGEISRQRNNTKKVLMAEKTREYNQAIRNARGEKRTQLTREFQRERQALLSSKPSLRWYESAGDSFLNALNALGSMKFSDAERRMLGRPEDET